MATISPTQSNVQAALRLFLLSLLPDGWEVISGGDNRVGEPQASTFVVMNQLRQTRLRTNIDSDADCRFTASISGDAMTVTAVQIGTISPGAVVFAPGIAPGTKVVSGPSGGGPGVYAVSISNSLVSQTMAAGRTEIEQGAEVVVQLDFHDASMASGDAAAIITTGFRDEYATQFFEDLGASDAVYDGIAPLYADDGRLVPFINENQQHEWRWIVEVHLQANKVVMVPTQYADSVEITPVSVDASFPP